MNIDDRLTISRRIVRGLTLALIAIVLILVANSFMALTGRGLYAQEPAPAVDPVTQCRAYIELVAKDRANAQTEASYFAARVQALQEANTALEEKVKKLEAKPDSPAKGTK
jgi:hypothetical protein